MTRIVFAVDVTSRMVSLGRVADTADGSPAVPGKKLVPVPPPGDGNFTPRRTWEHATIAADRATEAIIGDGSTPKPCLVVMARQQWGELGRDSSAQRRLELHAMIAARLHEADIPVAEYGYPQLLEWLRDGVKVSAKRTGTKHRPSTMADIEREVERLWHVEQPQFTAESGRVLAYPYRRQVLALAALGGMAVGIRTAVEVTGARVELMGQTNAAVIQWPPGRTPPESITAWWTLHERPEMLGAAVSA